MAANANLAMLQAAYKAWHETKGDSAAWNMVFDDNIVLHSMGDDVQALAFAKDGSARDHMLKYFAGLAKDWTMIHWTPETFVCEGDRIAMFGRCAWTNKATGKVADVRTAHLWTFANGKAIELTELFDSARAVAAAT